MKVTVNEQPKRFYRHFKTDFDKYEWKAFVGHEIKVGDHTFFIAALPNLTLNVTEATTGAKVFESKITESIFTLTETKEGTMEFYRKVVGKKLIEIIEKYPDIKERIKKMREENIKQAGEMPSIEDVDERLIIEPASCREMSYKLFKFEYSEGAEIIAANNAKEAIDFYFTMYHHDDIADMVDDYYGIKIKELDAIDRIVNRQIFNEEDNKIESINYETLAKQHFKGEPVVLVTPNY